ncbi:MAG: hypothetical protein J1E35_06725, partial [Lachnospiraceae bacterium]|nr:hypothetical protein [Lachnospiraceae bacterium]
EMIFGSSPFWLLYWIPLFLALRHFYAILALTFVGLYGDIWKSQILHNRIPSGFMGFYGFTGAYEISAPYSSS